MTTKRNAAFAAIALGLGLSTAPNVQAAFIATVVPSGPNVVVTGAGSIDLAGLSLYGTGLLRAGLLPMGYLSQPAFGIGSTSYESTTDYTGFSGPVTYGSGGFTAASSGGGDKIVFQAGTLDVPAGYVSGTHLSDTSTYAGATFASLGVTPGTYVWTWGSGRDADSFTLNITDHVVATPEPASLALLTAGLIALRLKRRRAT